MYEAERDQALEALQAAFRSCAPNADSDARENLMYGRTKWPSHLLFFVREQKLAAAAGLVKGMTLAELEVALRGLADTIRDTIYAEARDLRVVEPVEDALAVEAIVDGESMRDVAKLTGAPDDLFRLRQVRDSLARERDYADRARDVVVAKIHRLERAG